MRARALVSSWLVGFPPEELKVKIDEVRRKTCGAGRRPEVGERGEREELADALEDLSDHAVVMRDTLREEE